MAKYTAASRHVFAILDDFSPYVEPLSVDEAFLDIGGLRLHYDTPHDVAAARAIGADCVAVSTGGYDGPALQAAGATVVVSDLRDPAVRSALDGRVDV